MCFSSGFFLYVLIRTPVCSCVVAVLTCPPFIQVASNCRVTTNSTEIKCTTVAGMGGPHRWLVTIMEQTSVLSAPITSYARPIIESITPLSQTSDGKILGLRIVGVNFGLRNTDPKSIVFDQQELNENNGGFSTRQLNGGRDQIDVDLPACGGVQSCGVDKVVHFRARSMGVIVDSENTKTFSYTDPYIDELSVYPPANAGESGREVEARGWSFCESTACASLLFCSVEPPWHSFFSCFGLQRLCQSPRKWKVWGPTKHCGLPT